MARQCPSLTPPPGARDPATSNFTTLDLFEDGGGGSRGGTKGVKWELATLDSTFTSNKERCNNSPFVECKIEKI